MIFRTWNFQISRKINTLRKTVQIQNLIIQQGKYTSAKISPTFPLLVGGAGVNFDILNRKCYSLLQIRSLRLKVRIICLKHFFQFVIDDDRRNSKFSDLSYCEPMHTILPYVGNKKYHVLCKYPKIVVQKVYSCCKFRITSKLLPVEM